MARPSISQKKKNKFLISLLFGSLLCAFVLIDVHNQPQPFYSKPEEKLNNSNSLTIYATYDSEAKAKLMQII